MAKERPAPLPIQKPPVPDHGKRGGWEPSSPGTRPSGPPPPPPPVPNPERR